MEFCIQLHKVSQYFPLKLFIVGQTQLVSYCSTETGISKYLTQFFALPFLNHYPIEDRFCQNPA